MIKNFIISIIREARADDSRTPLVPSQVSNLLNKLEFLFFSTNKILEFSIPPVARTKTFPDNTKFFFSFSEKQFTF